MFFWECCFWGFWCLWWLFWVICFSLWPVFIHHGFQNGIRKGSKQWSRIKLTMSLKISRKSHQKWGPKTIQNEIAGLRQFLPRRHLLGFFLAFFCMAFWRSLGVSWAALGFLEALLGGLWTQKRVKTRGFLRFLKRLFKAHDGPLGLILVTLVNIFRILCKNPGPFCVSKLALNLI